MLCAMSSINPFVVSGGSGLRRSGRRVIEEQGRDLRNGWISGLRTFAEMEDNSPVVGAIMLSIRSICGQVDWHAQPADVPDADVDSPALYLTGLVRDMTSPWSTVLGNALTAAPYGFAVFEPIYRVRDPNTGSQFDDGMIGVRKVAFRSPHSLTGWEWDDKGDEVAGVWQQLQQPQFREVLIPREKMVLINIVPHNDSPEGRSLLRSAVRAYRRSQGIEDIEAVGIERDLVGVTLARMPIEYFNPSATEAQVAVRNHVADTVKHLKRNDTDGVLYPQAEGWDFSLVSSGGTRAIDTSAVIQRYEKSIAMSVLMQMIFLGMDGVGSFSLADVNTNMVAKMINFILDAIEDQFNVQLWNPVQAMAGIPPSLRARWVHGDIEKENLQPFVQMVSEMVRTGVIAPGEKLADTMRQKLDLPDEDESDEFDSLFSEPVE
jgi:hypothetical protein